MSGLVDFGNRVDNTPKGMGFFGILPMQDESNNVATEMSMTFDYGKGDTLVPLINPSLSKEELNYLLNGNPPTNSIIDKTYEFGLQRLQQGRSPFVDDQDTKGLTQHKNTVDSMLFNKYKF